MTDASRTGLRDRWQILPRWARIAAIAAVVAVLLIAGIVALRAWSRVEVVPLGATPIEQLRPGSCIAEEALDLAEYTVVDCGSPHPMQVFGPFELDLEAAVYAEVSEALTVFADEICTRYLEYGLYVTDAVDPSTHDARAIDVPSPADYEAGDVDGLCVLMAADGSDLTTDLHRRMP